MSEEAARAYLKDLPNGAGRAWWRGLGSRNQSRRNRYPCAGFPRSCARTGTIRLLERVLSDRKFDGLAMYRGQGYITVPV